MCAEMANMDLAVDPATLSEADLLKTIEDLSWGSCCIGAEFKTLHKKKYFDKLKIRFGFHPIAFFLSTRKPRRSCKLAKQLQPGPCSVRQLFAKQNFLNCNSIILSISLLWLIDYCPTNVSQLQTQAEASGFLVPKQELPEDVANLQTLPAELR